VIVVKKCIILAKVVVSHVVLHRSKIRLVLTTKVTTHLRSLLFRQQDEISSVVRRVYLAITAKLSQQSSAVCGLWVLTMLRRRRH